MTTMPPNLAPPRWELHTGVQGESTTLAKPRKDDASMGQAKGQRLVFHK
jgi:hypothetical protein